MKRIPFNYQTIIEEVQACDNGIIGTHLPTLSMHYLEFMERAGIDRNKYPMIQHYIENMSYAEKKSLFTSLGFDVLFMCLSPIKASHFATGRLKNQQTQSESLDDQFLAKKRNAFIFEVQVGHLDTIYFVLEYHDPDNPLADKTVDWEELAREKERQEQIRKIFSRRPSAGK